jgi:hypothetical protein
MAGQPNIRSNSMGLLDPASPFVVGKGAPESSFDDPLKGVFATPAQVEKYQARPLHAAPSLNEQLLMAIAADDAEEALRLIQAGANVNAALTADGMTPLMLAQSAAVVRVLLRQGADANRRDAKGATALHHLLYAPQAETILPELLGKSVNVNAVAYGMNRETPLLMARQLFFEDGNPAKAERIVRLLYEAGASINARDADGYTLLLSAVVNNKPAMTRLLLDLHADVDLRSPDGLTPLTYARQLGYLQIEQMLRQRGAGE